MDELSVWEGARLRRSERSLREQLLASSTLAGLFIDAAERGASVVVGLRGGAGSRAGVVTAVGADYVELGQSVLIPFAAVASVRGAAAGDRSSADGLSLAAAVSALAEEAVSVVVALDGGESVGGVLRAVAEGLLLVDETWVPLAAVRALQVV